MPGAVIVADQSTGAGAGVPGEAREDLWLAQAIALSVGTAGNTTYEWTLLDKPQGSAATLSTPTASTSGFTPDVVGTYRIRLVTNGGGAGNIQILVFRVRYNSVGALANRGWAYPAIGEVSGEANYGGNTRSWDPVLSGIFEDIRISLSALEAIDREIPIVVGVNGSSTDVFVTAGRRKLSLDKYPATLGTLSRVVRFKAVLENALHSAGYYSRVQLIDATNGGVLVVGTALNNSGESNRGIPNEFTSDPLTVGTSSGNIRSDVESLYVAQVAGQGITDPSTERAILTNARLVISYE